MRAKELIKNYLVSWLDSHPKSTYRKYVYRCVLEDERSINNIATWLGERLQKISTQIQKKKLKNY